MCSFFFGGISEFFDLVFCIFFCVSCSSFYVLQLYRISLCWRIAQTNVVSKEEVAEEFQQVHYSRRKDNAEGDGEGDGLDLGVVVCGRPGESNEYDQGDHVDEEPDRLEDTNVGDLVVRHVLDRTKEKKEVCPADKKSTDNSGFLHSLCLS